MFLRILGIGIPGILSSVVYYTVVIEIPVISQCAAIGIVGSGAVKVDGLSFNSAVRASWIGHRVFITYEYIVLLGLSIVISVIICYFQADCVVAGSVELYGWFLSSAVDLTITIKIPCPFSNGVVSAHGG